MTEMNDTQQLQVDEHVVLRKFEGEPLPENEFERLTVHNGIVTAHETVENGEVTGEIEDSELLGKDIGHLTQ